MTFFFTDLIKCISYSGIIQRQPRAFILIFLFPQVPFPSKYMHTIKSVINIDSWLRVLTNRISVFSAKNGQSNSAPIQVGEKSLKFIFLASILLHYIRLLRKSITHAWCRQATKRASHPEGMPDLFFPKCHGCSQAPKEFLKYQSQSVNWQTIIETVLNRALYLMPWDK